MSRFLFKVLASTTAKGSGSEVLYHGSKEPNLTIVENRVGVGLDFGGIFASYSYDAAASHGDYMYEIRLSKNEILWDIPNTSQVLSLIKSETSLEGGSDYENDLDMLQSVIVEEKNIFNVELWVDFRDFDEYVEADREDREQVAQEIGDSIQERICDLLGTADVGDAGWEVQRIRGVIAKKLGYKAVSTKDEHGTSFLVLPGVPLKRV